MLIELDNPIKTPCDINLANFKSGRASPLLCIVDILNYSFERTDLNLWSMSGIIAFITHLPYKTHLTVLGVLLDPFPWTGYTYIAKIYASKCYFAWRGVFGRIFIAS